MKGVTDIARPSHIHSHPLFTYAARVPEASVTSAPGGSSSQIKSTRASSHSTETGETSAFAAGDSVGGDGVELSTMYVAMEEDGKSAPTSGWGDLPDMLSNGDTSATRRSDEGGARSTFFDSIESVVHALTVLAGAGDGDDDDDTPLRASTGSPHHFQDISQDQWNVVSARMWGCACVAACRR